MRVVRGHYYERPVTLESDLNEASRVVSEEQDAIEEIRQRRFKKAMALKEDLGLTKEERHELAQLLVGVDKDDGGSWKDLNPKQLHDLITMMEGFVFLSHIFQNRLDPDDPTE